MPEGVPRYAIYYAPAPGSALWRLGSGVMGYDAATGMDVAPLVPNGVPADEWLKLTADPRKYGFHATIKAPFHLREGESRETLVAALAAFARTRAPVRLGRLAMTGMSRFVTLTAPDAGPALQDVAQASVEAFEPFRAPLTDADRKRRLASPLTPRQIELLDRYGYPYVAEEFIFHMTLAGPVPGGDLARVRDGLAGLYAAHVPAEDALLDRLCLFEQAGPDARFRIVGTATMG